MVISCIRTQLVGDDNVRSSQVKQCINDWIVSGPKATQSLSVGGSVLTVNLSVQMQCLSSELSCFSSR